MSRIASEWLIVCVCVCEAFRSFGDFGDYGDTEKSDPTNSSGWVLSLAGDSAARGRR